MMMRTALAGMIAVLGCQAALGAEQPVPKNVLFLLTSEGFAHSPTVAKDGEPPLAEKILRPILEKMGPA